MEVDFYGVIKGVRSLWADKLLLDYTIEVGDQQFKAHKVILAATSNYFRAMLTGGMEESQTDRVRLEGFSPLAVLNMIELIYTGEFGSDKADVEELLASAMYLQIPGAISECRILVSDEINPQNCFKLLSILQTYSAADTIEETVEYITSHFEEVYTAWRPENMTYTDVQNLIQLWQKSEWDLFLTIKHWMDVDVENHLPHLNDLMTHIRFALMTPKQLDTITNIALYSGFHVPWCQNVEKALRYHDLPIHEKILDASEQCKVRDEPLPFFFNAHLHEYHELRKDTSLTGSDMAQEDTWQKCKVLKTPRLRNGVETFVVVNNFLIVCERVTTQQKWHVFDPRMRKWSSMAELQMCRWESALVYCVPYLYVTGGCTDWPCDSTIATDIIERYDFTINSWSTIPSKLPNPVYKHGVAAIDGCIYVAGGLVSGTEDLSTQLDCFDTATGTWQSKASMPTADKGFRTLQVMTLSNEKVLFIMTHHLDIQYYSPSRNQWSTWGCDKSVRRGSSGLKWHANATVLSNEGNTLFLLNFMQKRAAHEEDSSDGSGGEECYHFSNASRSIQCHKWTFSSGGQEINQTWLEQFPDTRYDGKDFQRKFTKLMLLAVPPQATASLSML